MTFAQYYFLTTTVSAIALYYWLRDDWFADPMAQDMGPHLAPRVFMLSCILAGMFTGMLLWPAYVYCALFRRP